MKSIFKKNIQAAIAFFLLSGFTVWWYGFLNPYTAIYYREQSQLFLFDGDYFLQYLRLPGGATAYFASFLIQFFRFRWAGTLIYLCIFWCFYFATKATWKKFALFENSFFIAFIPALLFLPASINFLFDPADEIGVILALVGFIALTKLSKNRFYYLFLPLSFTALYMLIGGNAAISAGLLAVWRALPAGKPLRGRGKAGFARGEAAMRQGEGGLCPRESRTAAGGKRALSAGKPLRGRGKAGLARGEAAMRQGESGPCPRGSRYAAWGGVVLLSFLFPLIVWYFFYMVSFKAGCFSLTPFRYPDATLFDARSLCWWSVIILTIIGITFQKIRSWKILRFCFDIVLAALLLFWVVKQFKPDFENSVKMGFEAENQRWDDIIETRKKSAVNPLSCYYTNLALQQTGQMAEKMFHYDQIGTPGLFLEQKDHFSCYAASELFFRLGWINPAQYKAYESMSGYTFIKEANILNMKRLYDCAVMQRNSALSMKYGRILSRSLFYRNYANQRASDADYPPALRMENSLIRNMPDVLEALLEENNTNQAVFEYLMAWYLLERDYEHAKQCFDRYFASFSYTHIPTHYAEFLLLYKRINQLDDSFYDRYPISKELRERFDMMDTLIQSTMDKMVQQTLEARFKQTYWFYVRFPLVQVQNTPKDEKYIY